VQLIPCLLGMLH